ncbi:MAG: hypothetical protein IPK39_13270 [Sulfuritalea sp.]|nr:hypothetical protein [Sulfuritalea sp.]
MEVNDSWRRFSMENGLEPGKPVPHTHVGANYLSVCDSNEGPAASEMLSACNGIKAVLDGSLPCFTMEYACHSPTQQRWFTMNVLPLGSARRSGAVIAHTDITEYKRLEQMLHDRNVELERTRSVAEKPIWRNRISSPA